MGFETIPGLPGKIYVPKPLKNCRKKHRCRDCFSCDWCSEDRCRVCRSSESPLDRDHIFSIVSSKWVEK